MKRQEGQKGDRDLTERLTADIPPELLTFLRTKVNSFTKWDIVHFFYHNPYTTDTVENIARYIGRDKATTSRELAEMVAHGILTQSRIGEMTVYSLIGDSEIRNLLCDFVEASSDRKFRVKAIYHIIHTMR